MRQLNPKVAEDRKRRVLQWVVDNFIKTCRPCASSIIANEAGLELSSATIRSILKDLEDEGYLYQPHTSSGRIPTDSGYRFYVDYLESVQRLAAAEKTRIEQQYNERVAELDGVLSQTSKLLSHVSNKTGLVLRPTLENATLRRLELIPLGGAQVLAIVVTDSGQVRHWPVRLSFVPSAKRINTLNRFLNDHARGKSVGEIQSTLALQIEKAEAELRDIQELANTLLTEISALETPSERLILDGAASLMEGAQEMGDLTEIQSMMRVLEERQALTEILQNEFAESVAAHDDDQKLVRVRIGAENDLQELRNVSLVTTTYRLGDKSVGVLGILGPKRMEYARMISLVDHVSQMVSRSMESWDGEQSDAG
jgi:heat-inducible transcriptional repressor